MYQAKICNSARKFEIRYVKKKMRCVLQEFQSSITNYFCLYSKRASFQGDVTRSM